MNEPLRRARVNGLELHYEVLGEGAPIVLVHGGIGATEMFGALPSELARRRQVIGVHLQGHGRTPDVDRPLRYELLADDVAALVRHLGHERADVMGYSLGGCVALRLAVQHPSAVRRLVVVSAPYERGAFFPGVRALFDTMGPEIGDAVKASPLGELHPHVDFRTLVTKLGELLRRDYDWSADVRGIRAPVLLAFADADATPPSHAAEFFALLGGGERDAGLDGSERPASQLLVVPGRSHYDVLTSPVLAAAVQAFLDGAA